MSKSSYYYKKLAQSIIFSEENWKDIVDPYDQHDNVYTKQFLLQFQNILLKYYRQCCLEEAEKDRIFRFLNELRFSYPYQTPTEKRVIFEDIREMIQLTHAITSDGVNDFYRHEYEMRYGGYLKFRFFKELSYLCFSELFREGPSGIKFEISQDIYPLTLLFHEPEQLSEEHMNVFMMSSCFLSTINALEAECPSLLKDDEIRNRFLKILRKNRECFKNPEFASDEHDKDIRTRIQNELVLRRLEQYPYRKK